MRRSATSAAKSKASWPKDLATVAAAASIVLVGRSSLADHYHVPSGSMLPTVVEDDHILVNKAAYGLRVPFSQVKVTEFEGPARGDVVVLESPETGIVLLKRVVAIPGDEILVTDGQLHLNGNPVAVQKVENELREALGSGHAVLLNNGGGPDFGPVKLPVDQYLVLGDNRGNSRDGRYFGLVQRKAILGKATGILVRKGSLTWISLD
ncbi:MAG: signal peptidase I [Polyangiaceae bacterium]|nr:signal peptidase I [Polyangiaceae bacterium]